MIRARCARNWRLRAMAFLHSFAVGDFLASLVSLLAAFVLGGLIGAERQYRQRGGGLRTHVLVSVGAATFVDIGMHLNGNPGATQVIAYVVSGVGFLGAGVILKQGNSVSGLNTAATLWCSAAVGACAGADLAFEAIALTCFVLAGNTLLRPLVNAINRAPIVSGLYSPPSAQTSDGRMSDLESIGLDTCRTQSFCPNPSRSRCAGWKCLPGPAGAARGRRSRRRGSSPRATLVARRCLRLHAGMG